jgi:hypothetical protein
MGDIVNQDRAYTIEVLHALIDSYKRDWNDPDTIIIMPIKTLCSCIFLLVLCLGGMRGFKVMWTDLAALRYDLDYCEETGDLSAVSWPIVGRFEAHDGLLGCYMIPIATNKPSYESSSWSGYNVLLVACTLMDRVMAGQSRDPTAPEPAPLTIWRTFTSTTSLIDSECDVRADYGAQRSGRRFLTTDSFVLRSPKHEGIAHATFSCMLKDRQRNLES